MFFPVSFIYDGFWRLTSHELENLTVRSWFMIFFYAEPTYNRESLM